MDAKHVTNVTHVWLVFFYDGFGGVSHQFAFTKDSDMTAIRQWAAQKLAEERASFPVGASSGNKSLPERFEVEGVEVDRINLNHSYLSRP